MQKHYGLKKKKLKSWIKMHVFIQADPTLDK